MGQGPLLASLSSDIGRITIAFVRLPELVQGLVLTLGSIIYLGLLSPALLGVYRPLGHRDHGGGLAAGEPGLSPPGAHAQAEDRLYQNYQSIIAGSKGWRSTASVPISSTTSSMRQNARDYREQIIRADTYHLSAVNWSNIMMLGAIGLVFFLANGLGWANTNVAATFAPTLLFLRTPLLQGIGALPTLIAAQVAFDKIAALNLAEPDEAFPLPPAPRPGSASSWSR